MIQRQNLLKMAFMSLVFVFISCSKSDSNSDNTSEKKLHSYDLKFVSESGSNSITYTYAGSETNALQVGQFKQDIGPNGALTIDFTRGSEVIKAIFVLDDSGNPLNLDYIAYQSLAGSLFEFRDTATNRVFKGISGTVTITNKMITESSNSVRSASYKVSFSGEFELTLTETGETLRMIGTGNVLVGQSI